MECTSITIQVACTIAKVITQKAVFGLDKAVIRTVIALQSMDTSVVDNSDLKQAEL